TKNNNTSQPSEMVRLSTCAKTVLMVSASRSTKAERDLTHQKGLVALSLLGRARWSFHFGFWLAMYTKNANPRPRLASARLTERDPPVSRPKRAQTLVENSGPVTSLPGELLPPACYIRPQVVSIRT